MPDREMEKEEKREMEGGLELEGKKGRREDFLGRII
jgi:hypothetical protein